MSQLSQNLEKIIQMISIEQLLGLVKQNTDNKSNSDIMNLPIVQKVVKAYEDEIQVLQTPSSSSSATLNATSSLEKDYSGDIAKINEQLASINNNLLQLTEAIRNINISTKAVKREEEVKEENVVVEEENVVEEEHVRLKIEEKQEEEVISKAESELEEEEEEEDESSNVVVEEESEKEISDEESEEDEEEEVTSAAAEEEVTSAAEEEEEEEVFEIEIDDVTYYATSEENGILYEVDSDGEVGKKVGIIKDGEPIFS